MSYARFSCSKAAGLLCLLLVVPAAGFAAEAPQTDAPDPAAAEVVKKTEENGLSNETLRAYLQLQQQIHEAQLAIEHAREQAEAASVKSAEAFENRLQQMEQTVAGHRARELEAIQGTTRFMLVVLSAFAGLAFVVVLATAYFQWRTVSRLAEISAGLPATHALPSMPAMPAIGPGDESLAAGRPVEMANGRLLGVIERLEQRIHELEHTARSNPEHHTAAGNGDTALLAPVPMPAAASAPSHEGRAQIASLLDQGQSLLNMENAEGAIACFDAALELDPNHTEALVKKGAALEKLRKLTEAVECYDRAIAADGSMTIAYLHKGGLFNRMERFSEAVDCYEQALRTQEKKRSAA